MESVWNVWVCLVGEINGSMGVLECIVVVSGCCKEVAI